MIPAHPRYTGIPNANKLYTAICCALSSRLAQAEFASFDDSDWPLFLRMAQTERVAPLLYKALQSTPHVPDRVRESLHQSYLHTAARNTLLFHELDRVLQALDEANIPVVVLKGAALAQSLYGDIGLRPMNDLDLCVRPAGLQKAETLLRRASYRKITASNEIVLRKDKIQVDLHWLPLTAGFTRAMPPADWFWQNLAPYPAQSGAPIPLACIFNPTASFLALLTHLLVHHIQGESNLRWFYDLHLLVQKTAGQGLDWDLIRRHLSAWPWAADAAALLAEIHQALAAPFPPELLIWQGASGGLPKRTAIVLDALQPLGLGLQLRCLWGMAVPSQEFMQQRYGAQERKPRWIQYPGRWLDMIQDAFLSVKTTQ